MTFNLLTNPWIITTNLQGQEETLSLTDVLTQSHLIKSLSGEMPTQDIAILRLLLGVLYAIYTRTPEYENVGESKTKCIRIWKKLWEQGHFPEEEIQTYLQQYHDRFWLIHPQRPFYQVADIKKGSDFPVSKMIGDLVEGGNKQQLFSTRVGKGKQELSYPEAARWLLYLNSFDDAAAKPSERGAGLPAMSVGWLGQLGLVYVVGNNLFETLMLNFTLLNNDTPWENGPNSKATWELDEPNTGERTPISIPTSGQELFTLQSRRIQLKWENERAVGYRLLGGDQFPKEDAFAEPMTLWKFREGKKGEKDAFFPPSNEARNPAKQLWRDFAPLLAKTGDYSPAAKEEKRHLPGVLHWLQILREEEAITSRQVQICTLFVKYGNMQSGIDDAWGDSLSVNASLLSQLGQKWITRITKIVAETEEMVKALGHLAINIAKAAGSPNGNSVTAQAQAYAALDMPFRNWLANINPSKAAKTKDIDAAHKAWLDEAKIIVISHGKRLVADASEQAFIGRSDGKNYLSAPKAFGWFQGRILNIAKEEK